MPRFPSFKIEGGLLSADLIEKIFAGEAIAQKPQDFNLPGSESAFSDYLAFLWNKSRELWENFQKRLETLPPDDPATSLTRERFVIPLLELLDYKPTYQREAVEVDGKRFPLSHRADPSDEAPFIHIVGARQNLDRLQHGSRLSPHALVQEFLNKTEHLWAIVTNGEILRLLRDTQLIARQAFIEFNLKEMFSNELFADFQLFFRLVHRSRLPKSISDANECPLEKYHRESIEQGNRIRDKLRDSVEKALNILGTAILQHPKNNAIKEDVKNKKIKPDEFYQQLLRLIYRILFLLVAEERNLIGGTNIFRNYYSISRLRKLTEVKSAWVEHHDDLWINLQKTFEIFADENKAQKLGVAPLNGELFNPSNTNIINNARVNNADLLKALWYLCWFKPDDKSPLQRVNYAQLDVEELGSIYESLLDFHPTFKEEVNKLAFELTTAGTERKSTGSYYTPRSLVGELIKSALEPVLNEKLTEAKRIPKKDGENPAEKAILSIKVLDPACGSGHFLLAAARRLATELAKIRTGEEQPNPTDYKLALRDVVRHCIYGVDKNPLAVELCKVALWIESHAEGKPLAFLDHHIKCGDSLVGVLSINSIENGIPDDAYEPVAGDDKNIARKLKNQNKENKKYKYQYPLELKYEEDLKQIEKTIQTFIEIPDDEPEQIREKDKLYQELQKGPSWWKYKTLCNLWTAPFFAEFTKENEKKIPTSNAIFTLLNSRSATTIRGDISAYAEALALKHRFFHWELEFPEVFSQGGFDVILCNPPWERIKLQEEEFFSTRDPEIANATNKSARQRLIQALPKHNPSLWQEYQQALHEADALSKFLRESGRFPLTARGDINTYSVFAEIFTNLINKNGRIGVVLPTGIATDATNQLFFRHLIDTGRLVTLYDFENREKLFPAVDSRYKFSLLTLSGKPTKQSEFAFFLTRTEQLRDNQRKFVLSSDDFSLLNPNTRTCPVFRTRQDAELTKAIYKRVPVLVNEQTGENPWNVRFLAMFHMANDSHLFRTREELKREGYQLIGNRFIHGKEVYLPLYEAKMIWHYDHRFGTYEGVYSRSNTQLPTPDEHQHSNPNFLIQPWYWVPAEEVKTRLSDWKYNWLLCFRGITNATNERTSIFSLTPREGIGNTLSLVIFSNTLNTTFITCFIANFNCFVFDYLVRQKIGGTYLGYFILNQLPVLSPQVYTPEDLRFIVPRVLELVYTSWDIKPFADDVWGSATPELKEAIFQQWKENQQSTGGNSFDLPEWASAYPEITPANPKILRSASIANYSSPCPLPPFKWNEERRALLRAELDAYYARLYGFTRKQLRYILDPADLTEKELADILDPWEEVDDPLEPTGYIERSSKSTFPGETFRVLKEKEIRQFGEYRTRKLILEAWENLNSKTKTHK